MKRCLPILLLVVCASIFAQPLLKPVPEFRFSHFDRNRVLFPSDSMSFELFFDKMDKLLFTGEGNLNIVHIGGSHVQAGVFTQQFRRNLLTLSPGIVGGRGLVFPFSAARTNNPSSFHTFYSGSWVSCRNIERQPPKRLGLTGIAVSTSDPKASVTVVTREFAPQPGTPKFDFNTVRILGYADCDSVEPVLRLRGDSVLRGYHDKNQSLYLFRLPDYTDSITLSFSKSGMKGEFTLTGILLENNLPGITCHGIGVNGASLGSYFKCADFERDLALLKPDLMIFAIGVNDAVSVNFDESEFMRNYDRLIEKVRRVSPDCALLFVTNNDTFRRSHRVYHVNRNGELVEDAFFKMGEKYHAGVWNLFDIMGGLRSMQQWEYEGLAKRDKVHFTNKGYSLLGDLLYNALMERYMEHLRNGRERK